MKKILIATALVIGISGTATAWEKPGFCPGEQYGGAGNLQMGDWLKEQCTPPTSEVEPLLPPTTYSSTTTGYSTLEELLRNELPFHKPSTDSRIKELEVRINILESQLEN